ncbi:MAG TPA: bifunctional diaminohydroxyphosphoribosylaminopyrimidine deaminase/5-amino-6-(5-phosphoribosylamino)uracil reductase RibD [Ferruginibacter sp.]|nr:bifunctional diaminohydroxyphosphoribosylaminopyrimidine deaminase/5-amino-6-(5-phosphoribosylamino)uracil reductase RibD [Ferruginibacter sp.]
MITDQTYMQRCLELAKLGAGNVAPNPMVGTVLVYEERIIGEGYHQKYGQAHAEVNCINAVNQADIHLIQKSTLYVSLEPCAHFGKTPPCSELIIVKKIPRVVVGCRDSYEEVAGKGIANLEAAGVNVTVGILEKECLELNKRFFTFHEQQRPYIILKWAQSNDHKIGNADLSRVLISNEETNRLSHKWRSEEAAILIGTTTALHDNPSLTTRFWPGNNPIRLVIDMDLKLPASLAVFDREAKTIVFNRKKEEQNDNITYYKLKGNENIVPQLLKALYELKIQSVLIEGGTKTIQSFIDLNSWDEARVITNQQLQINNGIDAPDLKEEQLSFEEKILNDTINYYINPKSKNQK